MTSESPAKLIGRKNIAQPQFKIGDAIRRKDMPQLTFKIIGEGKAWGGHWIVQALQTKPMEKDGWGYKKKPLTKGMVFKDDDRLELVPEAKGVEI